MLNSDALATLILGRSPSLHTSTSAATKHYPPLATDPRVTKNYATFVDGGGGDGIVVSKGEPDEGLGKGTSVPSRLHSLALAGCPLLSDRLSSLLTAAGATASLQHLRLEDCGSAGHTHTQTGADPRVTPDSAAGQGRASLDTSSGTGANAPEIIAGGMHEQAKAGAAAAGSWRPHVTTPALLRFLHACTRLRTLRLRHCCMVSDWWDMLHGGGDVLHVAAHVTGVTMARGALFTSVCMRVAMYASDCYASLHARMPACLPLHTFAS